MRGAAAREESAGARLEAAAIERGVIPGPDSLRVVGAYGRDADRACVIERDGALKLGVDVAYGGNLGCTARGTAKQDGEDIEITLDGSRRNAGSPRASTATSWSFRGGCPMAARASAMRRLRWQA